jgi:putative Holliday junction resolvase
MTRLLGVDAGDERIGLAISDDEGRMALPFAIITRKGRGADWAAHAVAIRARECGAEAVIVGLPLNMDGSFGPQAVKARSLGRKIAQAAGLRLELWDERMSSFIAEQKHRELTKPGGRRRPVDDLAAAVILQSYIDSQSHADSEESK